MSEKSCSTCARPANTFEANAIDQGGNRGGKYPECIDCYYPKWKGWLDERRPNAEGTEEQHPVVGDQDSLAALAARVRVLEEQFQVFRDATEAKEQRLASGVEEFLLRLEDEIRTGAAKVETYAHIVGSNIELRSLPQLVRLFWHGISDTRSAKRGQ